MICLDTNYLILGLVAGSREAEKLIQWSEEGQRFCVSATVWYEFLCGPVNDKQISAIRSLIHRIIEFDETQAEEASRLFNAVGRQRPLRIDAMIAASAIVHQAPLATNNRTDFRQFEPHGLQLV